MYLKGVFVKCLINTLINMGAGRNACFKCKCMFYYRKSIDNPKQWQILSRTPSRGTALAHKQAAAETFSLGDIMPVYVRTGEGNGPHVSVLEMQTKVLRSMDLDPWLHVHVAGPYTTILNQWCKVTKYITQVNCLGVFFTLPEYFRFSVLLLHYISEAIIVLLLQ